MWVKDFSQEYNSSPLKQFEVLIMWPIHSLFLSCVLFEQLYSQACPLLPFGGWERGCDEEPFSLLYNLDEF